MKTQDLSARHFTTSAIHIVEQLSSRVADRGIINELNEDSATILAFWSLLRWERKVGLVALERMGVELDAMARDVDRALSAECAEIRQQLGPPTVHILPSGQKVFVVDDDAPFEKFLTTAEHEALGLSHNYVGSEHLLLAAVRLANLRLRAILDRHGVQYDKARAAVLELLQPCERPPL